MEQTPLAIASITTTAAKRKASTIHLAVGSYPSLRIDDSLVELTEYPLVTPEFLRTLSEDWLTDTERASLEANKEITFVKEGGKDVRLKINLFYQRGFLSAALRLIPVHIPQLATLGLPRAVVGLVQQAQGLIVIAGPYNSGKTTTIAALLQEINQQRSHTILTVEKPIEYFFTNQKSIIEQREVGRDVNSFLDALDYVKQTDANIVAVGTNAERLAIPEVLEFASSGRLAFMTMDTTSAVQTIEEIIASFPAEDHERARLLLADTLRAVVVQRLVPRVGGGSVVASEVLIATQAIASLIRSGKIAQIQTILQSSHEEGMQSLDQSLQVLVRAGEVRREQASQYAIHPESFSQSV